MTRQSMNVLLRALERDGLVTRPAQAPVGKVLPTMLRSGSELVASYFTSLMCRQVRASWTLNGVDHVPRTFDFHFGFGPPVLLHIGP